MIYAQHFVTIQFCDFIFFKESFQFCDFIFFRIDFNYAILRSTNSNCISFNIPAPDPYLGLFCNNAPGSGPNCTTGSVSTQKCIQQTRSSATSPSFNCSTSYREQLNLLSAYIDGSSIYGLNASRADYLRLKTGGLLKTSTGLSGSSPRFTEALIFELLGSCSESYLRMTKQTHLFKNSQQKLK